MAGVREEIYLAGDFQRLARFPSGRQRVEEAKRTASYEIHPVQLKINIL
jgi:hypothetical protein